MNTKNYFVRENRTEQQYFCQLQVSNKFRKSMNAYELELCNWMVQQLVHRTVTEEGVLRVLDAVERRVRAANDSMEGTGSYLLLSYSPLRKDGSGFIRVERTTGRHQSVLLPIIDCRGSVTLTMKDEQQILP